MSAAAWGTCAGLCRCGAAAVRLRAMAPRLGDRGWTRSDSAVTAGLLLAFGAVYVLKYWVLSDGVSVMADISGHHAVVWDVARNVPVRDWLGGGWSDTLGAGYPTVDLYSPVAYLPAVLLVSVGVGSWAATVLTAAAVAVMLPFAWWFSAHIVGASFEMRAAMWSGGLLTVLSPLQSNGGASMLSVIGGSFAHSLSMSLAFLACGCAAASLSGRRLVSAHAGVWVVGVIGGLAVSAHYAGAVMAAAGLTAVFAVSVVRPSGLSRFQVMVRAGATAAVAAAMSAHWWAPKAFRRVLSDDWVLQASGGWEAVVSDHGLPRPVGWPVLGPVLVVAGIAGLSLMAFRVCRRPGSDSLLSAATVSAAAGCLGRTLSCLPARGCGPGGFWARGILCRMSEPHIWRCAQPGFFVPVVRLCMPCCCGAWRCRCSWHLRCCRVLGLIRSWSVPLEPSLPRLLRRCPSMGPSARTA